MGSLNTTTKTEPSGIQYNNRHSSLESKHGSSTSPGLVFAYTSATMIVALILSQLAFGQTAPCLVCVDDPPTLVSIGDFTQTTIESTSVTTGDLTPWENEPATIGDNRFIGVEWDQDLDGSFNVAGGISFGPAIDTSGQVGIEALAGINPAGIVAANYDADLITTVRFKGFTSDGRRYYVIKSDEVDGTANLSVESSKLTFDLKTTVIADVDTSGSIDASFKPTVQIPKKTIDPNDYISWPGWLSDLGISEPNVGSITVPGTNVSYSGAPSVSVSTGSQEIYKQNFNESIINIDNGQINFPDSSVDVLAAALSVPGGVTDNTDGFFHIDIRVPTIIGAAITGVVGAATGSVDNIFGDFSLGEMEFYTAKGNLERNSILSSSNRSVAGSRNDYEITIAQDIDGIVAVKTQKPAEKSISTPALPSVTIPKLSATAHWGSKSIPYPCGTLLLETCHWSWPTSTTVTIFPKTTIPGPGALTLDSQAYDIDLLQTYDVSQAVDASIEVAVTYTFNQQVTVNIDGVVQQGSQFVIPRGKEFFVYTLANSPAGNLSFTAVATADFQFEKDIALKFRDVGMNLGGPEISFNNQSIISVGTAGFDLYTSDSTLVSSQFSHSENGVVGSAVSAVTVLDRLPFSYSPQEPGVINFMSGLPGGVVTDFSDAGVVFDGTTVKNVKADYYEISPAEFAVLASELLGASADSAIGSLQDYMAYGGDDGRAQFWNIDVENTVLNGGPVNLSFVYDDSGLSENEEKVLAVFHFDETNQWVRLDGIVDTAANTISVQTQSFSPFILGQVGPILTIPEDIEVEGNVTGGASNTTQAITDFIAAANATDESGNALELTITAIPGILPLGQFEVEFSATSSGITVVDSAIIDVQDTTPPSVVISGAEFASEQIDGSPIPDERGLISQWLGSVVVTDIVDPNPIQLNDAPAFVSVGSNFITFSAIDSSGNSTDVTVDLAIVNNPPDIDEPDDIIIEGNVVGGASSNHPDIQQFLVSAIAIDPEDGPLPVFTSELPEFLALNDTFSVTFSATDFTGWSNSRTATITVTDTTPPEVELDDLALVAEGPTGSQIPDAAGFVTSWLDSLLVTDVVDSEPQFDITLGNFAFLGFNTIEIHAVDGSGNESTTEATLEIRSPFVLYALNSIVLERKALVDFGMVAVEQPTAGPWLSREAQLDVGPRAIVAAASPAFSDSLFVDRRGVVTDAFTNSFTGRGDVLNLSGFESGLYFPVAGMPETAVGSESFILGCHVRNNDDDDDDEDDDDDDDNKKSKKRKNSLNATCLANGTELEAGDYGSLELKNGKKNNPHVLYLSGGFYSFSSLELGKHSQIIANGPTTLFIHETLETDKEARLLGGAFGPLGETGMLVFVGAEDELRRSRRDDDDDDEDDDDDDDNDKKKKKNRKNDRLKIKTAAVDFGQKNIIEATIYAANGSIEVGKKSDVIGALIGNNIEIGEETRLSFRPGF